MPSFTQPISKNPQLPTRPSGEGGYTDSVYEAADAQLRAEIARRYNDILAQLGYTDPSTGQHILGSVEVNDARQRAGYNRELGLAREGVTNQMRDAGTLFSGYRGTAQARAEHPYVSALADLDIDTPRTLAALYEQAGDLTSEYSTRNALLLAEMAQRRAGDITKNPRTVPLPPPGAVTGVPVAAKSIGNVVGGFMGTGILPAPVGPNVPFARDSRPMNKKKSGPSSGSWILGRNLRG